jgi:hypothetical protein
VAAPGRSASAGIGSCAPGGPPVTFAGTAVPADAKTYLELPFEVAAGTTRVEVTYAYTDPAAPLPSGLNGNVFDLGLWDTGGVGSPAGFRGWSGSRLGRTGDAQDPVFVQQDVAARGYLPDPIDPGTWHVDLGIAAIDPLGSSDWSVEVTCSAPSVGPAFVASPVDATHVARAGAGWYHGDFHMHGYHSNADAPGWQAMVDEAVAAGLDLLPITDYVTSQHWRELGPVQEANPDVLLLPGREVITYSGHANVIGETPSVLDFRHGAPGVDLGAIQAASVADGALFQVNHPTFFPGPVFANFCRGCEFTLDGAIDWDLVDTYEVLTGPASVSSSEVGLPDLGLEAPNPFMTTGLLEWQDLLRRGHRITAVAGSDSKGVEDDPDRRWGTSATAVFAEELSRVAIYDAVRAGHAYIRTLGVDGSPTLELTATAGGTTVMVGDSLDVAAAEMTARVRGAAGQVLLITRDGIPWLPAGVPIASDDFTHTWTADRLPTSGPLGTFWRVDVADVRDPALLTLISNPIFLGPVGGSPALPLDAVATVAPRPDGDDAAALAGGTLPATGGTWATPWAAALLAGALLARRGGGPSRAGRTGVR